MKNPGMQREQDCPRLRAQSAHVVIRHLEQAVAPTTEVHVPGAQFAHDDDATVDHEPALQVTQVETASAPTTVEKWPAAQLTH